MKFEYHEKEEVEREVVAVLWATHLVIKGGCGNAFVLCSDVAPEDHAFKGRDFDYYLNDLPTKKFYKGDKITITF